MASLKPHQKLFVVQHLACFYSISEIQGLIKEQWGLDIPANQLSRYNPFTLSGDGLGAELKTEFERARKAFVEDRGTIPIAQTNYRLRELDDLYRQAKKKGLFKTCLSILEQAAQDEGGKFTNRREISGPGGKPIEISQPAREVAGHELEAWRKEQAAGLADLMTPPTE